MNFMKTIKTPTINGEFKGKNLKDVINKIKTVNMESTIPPK